MDPIEQRSVEDLMSTAAADLSELRLDQALAGYRAAAALAPTDYQAQLGVARALLRMRDRENALRQVDICLALDDRRHEAYVVKGALHFLADDLDEAERALLGARERAPNEPEALLTLAQVHADRQDYEEADSALAQARVEIAAIPDVALREQLEALAWHVDTYRHLAAEDADAAYAAAQQVIALEAANPYAACLAYSNLGILEMRRKNYAQAVQNLEKAWEMNPHFYRAANALGRILLATGQPKRAAEVLALAVAHSDGDTADARYALAVALARSGRRREAHRQYGVALQRGLSGASLILAYFQRFWLADATRYIFGGGALVAVLAWLGMGNASPQVIGLLIMIGVLLALQRFVGRRR